MPSFRDELAEWLANSTGIHNSYAQKADALIAWLEAKPPVIHEKRQVLVRHYVNSLRRPSQARIVLEYLGLLNILKEKEDANTK